jgi:hypothetical protein
MEVETPEPTVHITWEAGLTKALHIVKTKASCKKIMDILREEVMLPRPTKDTSSERASLGENDSYISVEDSNST